MAASPDNLGARSADSPYTEVHVKAVLQPANQGKTFFGLIALLLLLAWAASAMGAGDAQPAAASASAKGGRTAQQIAAEIQTVGEQLAPLFASPNDLFEPAKRKAAAPAAVPALRKMIKLLEELQAGQPGGGSGGQERTQLTALLAALGDQGAIERLKTMAASPVAGDAAAGRSAQVFAAWLLTDGAAAAQMKVIGDLAALAQKYPSEPAVAAAAMMLAGTTRPDAKEMRQKISAVVTGTLKGTAAATAARQLEVMDRRFEATAKLRELEGKPLTLEGATPAGGTFSTASLKGKVVLIDFWASWCGPCKEELPKLKKFYAQYKGQGLEVVGVSCDNEAEELGQFLAQNRDMAWPQLFDPTQPGWHALAAKYNVNSIPTMFLIDRKGVVRSVEARANYEKLVPELLMEKAQ